MPITRPNSRLRRQIKSALPKENPDGLYLGVEFVSYVDLNRACAEIMHPALAPLVEQEFGKMHYTKDPTYHMKRKR